MDGSATANAGPDHVGAGGQLQLESQQSCDECPGWCWRPLLLARSWLVVEACAQSPELPEVPPICDMPGIATIVACIPV